MAVSVAQTCNALSNNQDAAELGKLLTAMQADIANLRTAAATMATKLNADAGVTDVDYAAPAALTSAA